MNDEQQESAEPPVTFTFNVRGIADGRRSYVLTFDETYKLTGEHPAEALEKLIHEIEWGIIDSYRGFTITCEPEPDA